MCWWEGETKRMERVRPPAAEADNARRRREHILAALNDGIEITGEGEQSTKRITPRLPQRVKRAQAL